jgi:hypothetical protein
VPANAIVATAVFVCIVSLINIGSTVAFNAVLSLASNAVCLPMKLTGFCDQSTLTKFQMMGTYLISIGRQTLHSHNWGVSLTETSQVA